MTGRRPSPKATPTSTRSGVAGAGNGRRVHRSLHHAAMADGCARREDQEKLIALGIGHLQQLHRTFASASMSSPRKRPGATRRTSPETISVADHAWAGTVYIVWLESARGLRQLGLTRRRCQSPEKSPEGMVHFGPAGWVQPASPRHARARPRRSFFGARPRAPRTPPCDPGVCNPRP